MVLDFYVFQGVDFEFEADFLVKCRFSLIEKWLKWLKNVFLTQRKNIWKM